MEITNLTRRDLEFQVQLSGGLRGIKTLAPGETRDIPIVDDDPVVAAWKRAQLISVGSPEPPPSRRLGVRLARPTTAPSPKSPSRKENADG